ncbi:MAG TPA: hypothetical protein VIG30_01955 [Ktedonobacterales bacterium]
MPGDLAQPAPRPERGGLWRQRGFLLLWGGTPTRPQPPAPDEQAFAPASLP